MFTVGSDEEGSGIVEDLADIAKLRVSRAYSRNPGRSSVQSVLAQEQKAQPMSYSVTGLGLVGGSHSRLIGEAVAVSDNAHGYLATPSNSTADSSAELSAAIRSSRFEYAWNLLRDRVGPFGAGSR